LVIRDLLSSLLFVQGIRRFGGNVFSLVPNSPLEPDWKTIREIFHYPVEIFASHEVGRPILDTSFWGVRGGSHLITPVLFAGWAYDARKTMCRFSTHPLCSPLSLVFCCVFVYCGTTGCSGTWFWEGEILSRKLAFFVFGFWFGCLFWTASD
jgi:hypothetical protein